MAKVVFLGLGVMGYPMAGHIATAGHDVTVYNRTTTKAEKWVAEHGGSYAVTPADAAADADFVSHVLVTTRMCWLLHWATMGRLPP